MRKKNASAVSGLKWSAIERFSQQGCRFFISLLLARILLPEQFGLLAMVTVFVTIAMAITDAGFSQAIIQKKELIDIDLCTAFYLNLVVGIVMMAILWMLSPLVAHFYGQPILADILQFLSLAILLGAFGQVHRAKLIRALEFRKLALVSIPVTIFSGIIAVWLALSGWGVWALVIQMLILAGMNSLLLWFVTMWRPSLAFSKNSASEMSAFGMNMAGASIVNNLFQNLYVLVIGKMFLPAEVAYYQRAEGFKSMSAINIKVIISRVTFPLFSRIQSDSARLCEAFSKCVRMLCLILFPVMGLLAGISEPLILTLIGDKWAPSSSYLSLLCIVGAFYPVISINVDILKAVGQSKLVFKLALVKRVILLALLCLTFSFGIQAIILGQIVYCVFGFLIQSHYTKEYIDFGFSEQLKAARFAIIMSLGVFGASLLGSHLYDGFFIRLISGIFCGGGAWLLMVFILRNEFEDDAIFIAGKFPACTALIRFLYPKSKVDTSLS